MTTIYTGQNFNINIKLEPDGELIGTLTRSSINGIAEFTDLKIGTDDSYVIVAYAFEIITGSSNVFYVGTYYLKVNFLDKIVRII